MFLSLHPYIKVAGMELRFEGEGVNEVGIEIATGRTLCRVHERYFRPAEVELLIGNPAKAKAELGTAVQARP